MTVVPVHVPVPVSSLPPATGRRRRALRPALFRELASLARAALLYPLGVTAAADRALLRLLVPEALAALHPTPVVLVHGYGGNRSNWRPLERRLAAAGFGNVYAMSYNPLRHDVPTLADRLVRDCREAMRASGVDRVHVVGHSLGGIVLRYAVQHLGLSAHVGAAVTIATPHRGAPVARLGRGRVAAALRPASDLLTELEATARPGQVRWTAYYSDTDLVVPQRSARLGSTPLRGRDVLVADQGHVSILFCDAVLDGAVADLLAHEDVPVAAAA